MAPPRRNPVKTVWRWASNFYLYRLAKNGKTDEAQAVIARHENLERPEVDRYLDRYVSKFDQVGAEDSIFGAAVNPGRQD